MIITPLKLLLYKLQGKKTIIINEAAGLGDYIHARNYPALFKASEKYKDYKIIFCCAKRWIKFAEKYDYKYIDVFLPLNIPTNPKYKYLWYLKYFEFDVFVDFRYPDPSWGILKNNIKAKEFYYHPSSSDKLFYTQRHNALISQIVDIPDDFKNHFEFIRPSNKSLPKDFTILATEGLMLGSLSYEQVFKIVELFCLNKKKIMIFGNKNHAIYKQIAASLNSDLKKYLLNGVDKYKIWELPYVINKANFVILPNTGTYHMALALDKKGLCFSQNTSNCVDFTTKNITYLFNEEISQIPVEDIINTLKVDTFISSYFQISKE